MSAWAQMENVLFVITLVDVFGVLVLALNFLIHVLIVAIVQLVINIAFLMRFFTILVLLVVYIRDAFRLVNNTYATHHATVLGYVKAIEEEDLKKEANKDWREQENKIFKIVPSSAADAKGRTGKDQEEYEKKKLFLMKNDALRMRTRSLALFLDKDDIPYIPKKFLEHTTTISCPGSPGRVEEAYLRALGRFGRTLVFLMLILLPLLAYASTYEVSNNLQFFAILFTGTIPLVMRYFCMSQGTMLKAEMSAWAQMENVLFVITLVDVFGVLVLALNFLIHVLIVAIVQLVINIAFLMRFFTILVLLVVYIRDAFRLVNNTYATHHATVLGYVKAIEEEDLKKEANKDWREQENKIFKIVPSSAADAKGRTGKDQEEYEKKKLFLMKNDALRMRTRSLALFLDKDDIPYIPKKFLEHTTTISCPGSPGRVEEAYLRALGRFGRTLVFLMLILLPLLAYASTYEVSNNLQFFAILFTGTIPLVMRYFCMSQGTMLKAEMSAWAQMENVLFVITLVDVFGVLVLALNFLIHVLIVAIVQLVINIAFLMRFFTILVLLVVYIRDAFRLVNNTYATHHATVLGYVKAIEEEDLKKEANKDWREQENKIFKIVPSSAADAKGRTGKDQEEYEKKKLFLMKNDALRMRTRSLALFLDKDDIPYIPKKFLEHTTTISCPGSPGRVEEAYLRALGRFGRTLVFLMLILLPLLAYASTYEVSNNLQFFAILFTGTIPLVMRYFCMSQGTMLKVDTSTPRFVTQMDDKVESFMQTWVVEDVVVDHFRLPHEDDPDDDLHDEPDRGTPKPTQPPSPLVRPAAARPGHLNFMVPESIPDAETGDDWFNNRPNPAFDLPLPDEDSAEPNGPQHLPRAHKSHKKEKRRKKKKAKRMDDLLAEKEEGAANTLTVLNGTSKRERTPTEDGVHKKPKKKQSHNGPVRVDLILDIRDDKMATSGQRRAEEGEGEAVGGTKPPYIHWNRRSRLVDENKARGDFDV